MAWNKSRTKWKWNGIEPRRAAAKPPRPKGIFDLI
jgi:hypothetical protein